MRQRNFLRKVQQERYKSRRFQNPYFRKETKRSWKPWILIGGGFGLLVATVGYLGSAPVFATNSIEVSGTETISQDDIHALMEQTIHERRWFFFSGSNSFFFEPNRVREILASHYTFEATEVVRTCEYFDLVSHCKLSITVKEKTSQLLWRSAEKTYLADLQGVVIRELSTTEIASLLEPEPVMVTVAPPEGNIVPIVEPPLPTNPLKRLPIFSDVNESPVTVGNHVLTTEEVTGLFRFTELLDAQSIRVTSIEIDRLAGKWVSAQTVVGYDVLFDPVADVDGQAERLKTVLTTENIADPSKLQYIDVRFGDRVYYK